MTTAVHERRCETLRTLAYLAGCCSLVELEAELRPDVLLADNRERRLFVGDAKATETAHNAATARRLRRYLRAAMPWRGAGYQVRLAVCSDKHSGDWLQTLADLAAWVGAQPAQCGQAPMGTDSKVAWVDLRLFDRDADSSLSH